MSMRSCVKKRLERYDLTRMMHIPKNKVRIVVVDDSFDELEFMAGVLENWLNIECLGIYQKEGMEVADVVSQIPFAAEVVLLDEGMQGFCGSDVAISLQESGFKGVIASTTGGHKPDYTKWHYGLKGAFGRNPCLAIEKFILFVNSLLKEIGKGL